MNADTVEPPDTDAPISRRKVKVAAVLVAVVAVTLALAWSSVQDLAVQRASEGHGITSQLAGMLSGTSDAAIASVDIAHLHVNDQVWGSASDARQKACDRLAGARDNAAVLGYSLTELKNIDAVHARCMDDSVSGYDLHESVVGLEHYLRMGQGR